MKISLSIPDEFTVVNHGYGVICQQIVQSLQRLGYQIPFQDATAPVELSIGQPYHWRWFNKDSYKIGMSAWESTKIPANWKPCMTTADEIWTPSPVMADLFTAQGFPAKVYEHGIDASMWRPKRRKVEGRPLRFLHMGEPAPRKGGQMTYDAFKELFGNDLVTATLTIKAHNRSNVRGLNSAHPDKELNNVRIITDDMGEWELIDLVRRHDVLVYPSWGEGFGLIPLQAMATGMPVICTEAWAPYKFFLLPDLRLSSTLDKSPWSFHTGQMWRPDYDNLKSSMLAAVANYDKYAQDAYDLVPFITKRYNWDRLTAKAFGALDNRRILV